jgi:hypothetical protein
VSVKLFLMTKNEIELLEDWLKYHGYLFGLENIHVLDGSDDQRVFDIYDKYKPLGLRVHFSSVGLNGLADELTLLMHAHKGSNNFLIKLDTDEFLAHTLPVDIGPEGRLSRTLHDRYHAAHRAEGGLSKWLIESVFDITHGNKKLCSANFTDFFEALPITGQRYKASLTTWSVPQCKYVAHPARELVEFTQLQFTHLKSYFHSESFLSADLGSHSGVSTNNRGVVDTGLTLIHYHSTSVEDSVRRARQVLVSHEYIDVSDAIEIQRKKLSKLRVQGCDSYHKIDLYLKHLDALEGGEPVYPRILNHQHPHFRQPGRSVEMTLVRDTLSVIDQEKHFGK